MVTEIHIVAEVYVFYRMELIPIRPCALVPPTLLGLKVPPDHVLIDVMTYEVSKQQFYFSKHDVQVAAHHMPVEVGRDNEVDDPGRARQEDQVMLGNHADHIPNLGGLSQHRTAVQWN